MQKGGKRMLTLKNWYVDAGMQAHGIVYGHYRLGDGQFIHTSWIMKVYRLEGEEPGYVLETMSGSLYQLWEKEMEPERKEKTLEALAQEEISVDDSLTERLKAVEEDFLQRKRSRDEVFETAQIYAKEQMENNELYLLMEHGMTRKALHKYENEIYEVTPQVHTGMFQDSVLIMDLERGKLDFRYFPNATIECYCWSGELKKVHIYNLGKQDFKYGTWENGVICKHGEVTVIEKESKAE